MARTNAFTQGRAYGPRREALFKAGALAAAGAAGVLLVLLSLFEFERPGGALGPALLGAVLAVSLLSLTAIRRGAQQRLRTLESLWAAPGGVGMALCRSDGMLTDANPAFLQRLGYGADLPTGLSSARLGLTAAGEAGPAGSSERKLRHRDGQLLSVLAQAIEVPSATAGPPDTLWSILEVPSASQSQELFRNLVEFAPDAMIIADGQGQIVLVNGQAEQLFGYPRHELISMKVEQLVPMRSRGQHAQLRHAYHTAPKVRPMGQGMALSGVRKDGSELPVEIALSPVLHQQGGLVAASVRDVTLQRQAAEALRQARDSAQAANRELEAFSYSVSHDLRAPLRSLDGFSQALLDDYGDRLDDQGKDYLQRVRAAAQRMAQLIDDLLQLSRVSRSELRRETVDLSSMVRQTVEELTRAEPDRQVLVEVAEGLMVTGDSHLLRLVLVNLLSNAWKFTRQAPRPHIEVTGQVEDGASVVVVRDNGAGFDMKYADKLFTAFQRLHRAEDFPGTGIGLATAQRIIHRHGGTISAQSEVGQGATFRFSLPGPSGIEEKGRADR